MQKIVAIVIFSLVFLANLSAQNSEWLKGWNAAPTFCYGKIIKHTPKFQPEIQDHSKAFELAIAKKLHGKEEWEFIHHYPVLGFAGTYNDLGNDSVLGNAFSLMPFIEIPIVSGKKISATFRVGTGVAYLTKHYDREENPTNNVIASRFNDITQFAIAGNWVASDHITLSLGASFTHYSTGAVRLPNLGINIPAWRLGIRYTPRPFSENEFIIYSHRPASKKIIFDAQPGLGFQESSPAYGPMYHVYEIEFSAGRLIRNWCLLSGGAQVNYKQAAYAAITYGDIYTDHFFANSLAASAFGKSDFLFGNIGIALYMGDYFYSPSPLQLNFYQKLGCYYTFLPMKIDLLKRITAGVYVTAGDFTADFVSTEIGIRF